MGTFTNAFIREFGKNTGKVVSNVIFGDSWSTPHRRTDRIGARVTDNKSKHAQRIEAQQELERQRVLQEQDRLHNLKTEEIIAQSERDFKYISTLEFKSADHARECLNDIYCSLEITSYAIKANLFSLFISIIIIICVVARIFWSEIEDWFYLYEDTIIGAVMAVIVISFLIIVLILDGKSGWSIFKLRKSAKGILKKLETAYFKRYKECLSIAEPVLSEYIIKVHKNNIFNISQRRVFRNWGLFVIFWWLYRLIKSTTNKRSKKAEQPNEVFKTRVDQEQTLSYDLIDLNKNLRIENRLSAIWNRYSRGIGVQSKRRPLFVCDSPANSILYVGINPSYNRTEDDFMIKSIDGKSLYYESLYQEENAPQYFKLLEAFTRDVSQNMPYSHMNLLYAREDNREVLLKMDHNFIREQLELSYESITMLKPKAIVFFSSYCKDMIFGADRWVNPASYSSKSDSYILNGTNTPVIFSEDVTLLDMVELSNLEQRLQIVVK